MGTVVCKHSLKREPGFLYFVNKLGQCARVKMKRPGMKGGFKQEVLHQCGIKRQPGLLYYVDKAGNVASAKMSRGGRKKKVVKKKK